MYRPGGYVVGEGDGPRFECDTYGCGHCSGHTLLGPKQRPEDVGGLCFTCGEMLCPRCNAQRVTKPCQTIEAWLDETERNWARAEAFDARAKRREAERKQATVYAVRAAEASYHARRSYGF